MDDCNSILALSMEKSSMELKKKKLEKCKRAQYHILVSAFALVVGTGVAFALLKHMTRAKVATNTYFMSFVIFSAVAGSFGLSLVGSYQLAMKILLTYHIRELVQTANDVNVYRGIGIEDKDILSTRRRQVR